MTRGGVLGNLQPERVLPVKKRRSVNRPQAEVGGLSGRERPAAYRRRRLSGEFHFRRDRALGDDARIKEAYRDEVGSGAKRWVGAGGNDDPFVARDSLGGVVRDNPPILNGVVLSKADIQIHIDIGIDGFQREGYAGGVLGNLQPERVIPTEEPRGVNRPQAEVGGLSGRERAASCRLRRLSGEFHFRREFVPSATTPVSKRPTETK